MAVHADRAIELDAVLTRTGVRVVTRRTAKLPLRTDVTSAAPHLLYLAQNLRSCPVVSSAGHKSSPDFVDVHTRSKVERSAIGAQHTSSALNVALIAYRLPERRRQGSGVDDRVR